MAPVPPISEIWSRPNAVSAPVSTAPPLTSTSKSFGFSRAFRFTFLAPKVRRSMRLPPWTKTSPPSPPASTVISISDLPFDSFVAPGARGPLAREIVTSLKPLFPVIVIVSVFLTVAAPQRLPPTVMPSASSSRSTVVESEPPSVTVTSLAPALYEQFTAAEAGIGVRSATRRPAAAAGNARNFMVVGVLPIGGM